MSFEEVLERIYNLRRDKQGTHERPHKPVLLLTLLDLAEAGIAVKNNFVLDDVLFDIWRSYFDVVKIENDQPTVENPIFHLCGDEIWKIVPKNGGPDLYRDGNRNNAPSKSWLKENVLYGQLDPATYEIVAAPRLLIQLRKAIMSRYFPNHWELLQKLSLHNVMKLSKGKHEIRKEDEDKKTNDARDGAFRKLILNIYDRRCTACGLRLFVRDMVIVDAAHLIPWSESHNDHPTNGITLCKNHHWAMDRKIIAPGIDRIWHVSPLLDHRVNDHRDLIELDGQPLFEPDEEKFFPSETCLKWREERLLS